MRIRELGGKIVNSDVANFQNIEGFRLPTEVEWEWFSRWRQKAIDEGTFNYTYSGSNNIDEVAWFVENSNYSTQDVELKKPNQLGIYNCSGNVWEWCYDTTENIENGKSYIQNFDMFRELEEVLGLIWELQCSFRFDNKATFALFNIGFHFVRTI